MRAYLSTLLDRFQAKYPPNRRAVAAMALLVPLVITPVAGYIATWAAIHLPGTPGFGKTELVAAFSVGGLAGLTAAGRAFDKWLDGWQSAEARESQAQREHMNRVHEGAMHSARHATREAEMRHELRMAVVRTAESPWQAQEFLDEVDGQKPSGPSAAVEGADPPPPVDEETLREELGRALPDRPPTATMDGRDDEGPEVSPEAGGGSQSPPGHSGLPNTP